MVVGKSVTLWYLILPNMFLFYVSHLGPHKLWKDLKSNNEHSGFHSVSQTQNKLFKCLFLGTLMVDVMLNQSGFKIIYTISTHFLCA
jgi:hypothetical protein